VIARMNVGGPSLHVSYLTRELDLRGYETTLVAGRVGEEEGSMSYVAEELGVEPLYVPELQRAISPAPDLGAVLRLRSLIRELRPHIIHTHTAKAGAVGRAAALAAGRRRPPVVVHTFHGHVLRGYFDPATTAFFRQLERRLARITDALVAVSPQVRDDLVRLGVAPANRFAVIRLGLDLEQRTAAPPDARQRLREELGIPEDRFVVGWLGRMTEIKRADDLIRALASLRRRGAEADLLLVGDGPLRPMLTQLADALGVLEHTHFVGYRSEVGEIYAAVDAFGLTSANEGTPATIIEAQAAGLPIVSTDVGGVADIVRDGETGILTLPGDVEAIADGLARLAGDSDLRRRMGAAGRERVVGRYSVPRLVDDIDRLYRTLLGVTRPRERSVVGSRPRPLTPVLPRDVTAHAGRAEPKLKVLLLSQYFPPEVGATQTRMQAFAEYLSARGHDVTVICEFPNHPQGVIPPDYRGRVIEDERTNGYRVIRVWVNATEEKTQRTRMTFYLSYMTLATLAAPLAGRPDVVLATTPPLFTGAAGAVIGRAFGAPLVLDVRDLWPAAAVSLDQISGERTRRLAESLERWLYREAAQVVAVTEPFCRHIATVGRPQRPPVLIPNGTLESFFVNGDRSAGARLGIDDDRFLVTFAGTLGIAQALPSVIDAAEVAGSGFAFLLVGDGPLRDRLIALARDRGLDNVSFHGQVPLEEIQPLLSASDALLVSLSAHPTFRDFVPSKMIDFMATGKPIVLAAAGESARILEESGAGIAVAPENPTALVEALRWLADHPEHSAEMGRRGRAYAIERLRSHHAARLESVLLDLMKDRQARIPRLRRPDGER
jgi:glycosyltransferase involved in cell wall biosynthesis